MSDELKPEIKVVDVNSCARCGENHKQIQFKRFIRPINDPDGTVWDYWGLCPNTNDPILLRNIETDKHE